jgi:hypothetical protein
MFRCIYDDCDSETKPLAAVKPVLDITIVVVSTTIMATMVVS